MRRDTLAFQVPGLGQVNKWLQTKRADGQTDELTDRQATNRTTSTSKIVHLTPDCIYTLI